MQLLFYFTLFFPYNLCWLYLLFCQVYEGGALFDFGGNFLGMNFFRDTEGTFFLPVRKVFHWLPQFTPLRMIKHPNLFKAVRYVLYVSSLLIYCPSLSPSLSVREREQERIMACIPPNPRRVGYIFPIHGPLDEPLYMGSHIHQQKHQSDFVLGTCY